MKSWSGMKMKNKEGYKKLVRVEIRFNICYT